MPMSSVILESYQSTSSVEKDTVRYEENLQAFINATKGEDLLAPLNYYIALLNQTDRVTFLYLDTDQKSQILRNLQITHLLLLAQIQIEKSYGKFENLNSYQAHINKCKSLIDALLLPKAQKDKGQLATPELDQSSDGRPVAYLGISLGQVVAEKITSIADRKTKTIKDAMDWFNEKRLYWVWGSVLLKTIIGLMPQDFYNINSASQTLRSPDPYTGCISWGLYYFRFSVNLSLLLKHTIKGPWMTDDERQATSTWTDRFITQWDQRKFGLLNDLVWATGNIVCFFILTGKSVLGTWGDLLTAGLLIFDITLATWDFAEQETQHNKELLNFQSDIERLTAAIATAKGDEESEAAYAQKIAELKSQLATLQRAMLQSEKDWEFKKLGLINSTAYAVGLLFSFMLLAMPFIPVSAGAMLILGTAGAVLCFTLSIIHNAMKGGIEIYKAYSSAQDVKQVYLAKIETFKTLLESNSDLNDNSKKLLFLEIKGLKAEQEYQQGLVLLHSMHLIRSIIFESIVPAVIFASFVFFPTSIGLGIMGGVLALALGTNMIINQFFTPKKGEMMELSDDEYRHFCSHVDNKQHPNGNTFFHEADQEHPPLPKGQSAEPDTSAPLLSSGKN